MFAIGASQSFIPALKITQDVNYGAPDGLQLLDVYSPLIPGAVPMVLIHGGEWAFGDNRTIQGHDWTAIAKLFAHRGFLVFVPNYRLTVSLNFAGPQSPIDDLLACNTFARANAANYCESPANMLVGMGESAGGHLGSMVTIQGVAGGSAFDRWAAWSGVWHLRDLATYDTPTDSLEPICQAYMGGLPRVGNEATWDLYSPRAQVSGQLSGGRSFRIIGCTGELLPQAQYNDTSTAFTAVGQSYVKVVFAGVNHGTFEGPTTPDGLKTCDDLAPTVKWLKTGT